MKSWEKNIADNYKAIFKRVAKKETILKDEKILKIYKECAGSGSSAEEQDDWVVIDMISEENVEFEREMTVLNNTKLQGDVL